MQTFTHPDKNVTLQACPDSNPTIQTKIIQTCLDTNTNSSSPGW